MAKITERGPSNARAEQPVVPAAAEAVSVDAGVALPEAPVLTEPGCQHPACVLEHPHAGPAVLPVHDQADDEGGAPSPGSSSSTSPERQPTTGEPSKMARQRPARTTGSPSRRGRAGSGIAGGTGGSGPETRSGDTP